jgi:hypothetical protein
VRCINPAETFIKGGDHGLRGQFLLTCQSPAQYYLNDLFLKIEEHHPESGRNSHSGDIFQKLANSFRCFGLIPISRKMQVWMVVSSDHL